LNVAGFGRKTGELLSRSAELYLGLFFSLAELELGAPGVQRTRGFFVHFFRDLGPESVRPGRE
jgi:hypothetical protein